MHGRLAFLLCVMVKKKAKTVVETWDQQWVEDVEVRGKEGFTGTGAAERVGQAGVWGCEGEGDCSVWSIS